MAGGGHEHAGGACAKEGPEGRAAAGQAVTGALRAGSGTHGHGRVVAAPGASGPRRVGGRAVRAIMGEEKPVARAAERGRRHGPCGGEVPEAPDDLPRDGRGRHRSRAGAPDGEWAADVTGSRVPAGRATSRRSRAASTARRLPGPSRPRRMPGRQARRFWGLAGGSGRTGAPSSTAAGDAAAAGPAGWAPAKGRALSGRSRAGAAALTARAQEASLEGWRSGPSSIETGTGCQSKGSSQGLAPASCGTVARGLGAISVTEAPCSTERGRGLRRGKSVQIHHRSPWPLSPPRSAWP